MENKSSYTPKQTALIIALTAIFGSVSPLASAVPTLNATADYDIGLGSVNDSDGPSATIVDILDGDSSTSGNVFYHTYGNATGNFGARVSGAGIFDITSTFSFSDTFTNNSGISQDYFFDFSIIPGEISTSTLDIGFTPENLYASYDIDVLLTTTSGTTTIFDSAASIATDNTGSVFSESGTSLGGDLFGNTYFWSEYTDSLALGSFGAGDIFSIDYTLTTTASSDVGFLSSSCGGFFGGEGGFDGGEGGGACSASARSGDPFGLNGGNTFSVPSQPSSSVPEPGTLLLMSAGLAGMIGMRRKKKAEIPES